MNEWTRNQYASLPRQCNTGRPLERFGRNFCVVDGFQSLFYYAKFQHYGYRNVGLSSSKSRNFRIFGKNLPKDKSSWATFAKLSAGKVFQVRILTPVFTVVALRMWAYRRKIAKIVNFWYKFAQKWYIPVTHFYKIWHEEGVPGTPSCQISPISLLKCGLTVPKIVKIGIFGINLSKRGKFP